MNAITVETVENDAFAEACEIVALLPDRNGNDYYGNHYPLVVS